MLRPNSHRFFAYALILTLAGSLFSFVLPAVPSYASHENITVNISDEVSEIYRPGDSLVVEGIIDDVEEDEDVTIRILNPNESEEEEQDVTPDEDDGYFAFTYDIPNNADGGIWTVEVRYNGDRTYTYFMVEYDEDEVDVITVDLDQSDGLYQAEDRVEIEGTVFDEDPDEEFVRIIVLDPNNKELVDDDEVELDDEDFSFDFDLPDEHGRYAVLVTYDDQEGAAVLEVEDEDEGSSNDDEDEDVETVTEGSDGDLTAEIDEDVYAPGATVTITGEIEDYDPDDNEDLAVSVLDPDDKEFEAEDDVDVESDGDFEYEFDLDDDAEEGAYTITVSYDNDEVELIFEVEEGGSSGSGSEELTVKLNKASYMAGETMTVSGTVEDVADPDEGELVSILMYDPDNRVILRAGASKYVEPSSNGAYSATIIVPSDLEPDDGYKIIVGYLEDQVEATFSIAGRSSTPSDELTLETDEEEYEIGSTVEIFGEVPEASIVKGHTALIFINKPDGSPCRADQIDVPASGTFSYSAPLGGNCAMVGEYEVKVTYTGVGDRTLEGETTFEVFGSSVSTFNLRVEGDTYPIDYEIDNGAINSIFVRPIEKKLVITLDSDEDGQLTVVLPREVIDAIEDGEDIDFTITTEDASGNVGIADFEETENTDDERKLVISYEAGTDRIEITGTQVVPEFGAIAAIVLAVSIVGIIVATARFGNKFSLFRQ